MNSATIGATPVPLRLWLFWLPFLLGSVALACAVLLAQVPGKDRTLDLVMFSAATTLLAGSLWLGFFWSKAPYRGASGLKKPVLQALTGIEFLLAIYGAAGALTYRGL